ncbi:MAG: ankyrin repeat domain-containing protein [Myxococcaceae bacterium]|nr:MAG: ankyrin repeat domain-containing protein [Myxococcaceae bacterium]
MMIRRLFTCIIIVLLAIYSGATSNSGEKSSKSELSQADQHILHAAAQGLLSEIKNAVNQGANIDVTDEKAGASPLMWAAKHGYIDIVKYLLSKKANLNIRSKDRQQSAIMWAAYSGHLPIINLLIAAGADPEEENYRGDTPLSLAAFMGHEDIVDRLIKLDADVDFQTKQIEFSALHFAAFKGHVGVVKRLLKAGAGAGDRPEIERIAVVPIPRHGLGEGIRFGARGLRPGHGFREGIGFGLRGRGRVSRA